MERFCLAIVNTGDKYKAFEIGRYKAKTRGAETSAISRLLRTPKIKRRIEELNREYFSALGITEERILGNLAEIVFNKNESNQGDRIRALELLGRARAMWTDKLQHQYGGIIPPDVDPAQAIADSKAMIEHSKARGEASKAKIKALAEEAAKTSTKQVESKEVDNTQKNQDGVIPPS